MTLLKRNVALRKSLNYRFKSIFVVNKNYRFLTALLYRLEVTYVPGMICVPIMDLHSAGVRMAFISESVT